MSEDVRTAEQIRFTLDRTLLYVFEEHRLACERESQPDRLAFLQGLIRSDIEAYAEKAGK